MHCCGAAVNVLTGVARPVGRRALAGAVGERRRGGRRARASAVVDVPGSSPGLVAAAATVVAGGRRRRRRCGDEQGEHEDEGQQADGGADADEHPLGQPLPLRPPWPAAGTSAAGSPSGVRACPYPRGRKAIGAAETAPGQRHSGWASAEPGAVRRSRTGPPKRRPCRGPRANHMPAEVRRGARRAPRSGGAAARRTPAWDTTIGHGARRRPPRRRPRAPARPGPSSVGLGLEAPADGHRRRGSPASRPRSRPTVRPSHGPTSVSRSAAVDRRPGRRRGGRRGWRPSSAARWRSDDHTPRTAIAERGRRAHRPSVGGAVATLVAERRIGLALPSPQLVPRRQPVADAEHVDRHRSVVAGPVAQGAAGYARSVAIVRMFAAAREAAGTGA